MLFKTFLLCFLKPFLYQFIKLILKIWRMTRFLIFTHYDSKCFIAKKYAWNIDIKAIGHSPMNTKSSFISFCLLGYSLLEPFWTSLCSLKITVRSLLLADSWIHRTCKFFQERTRKKIPSILSEVHHEKKTGSWNANSRHNLMCL